MVDDDEALRRGSSQHCSRFIKTIVDLRLVLNETSAVLNILCKSTVRMCVLMYTVVYVSKVFKWLMTTQCF